MKAQRRTRHGPKLALVVGAAGFLLLPKIGVAGDWTAKNASELIAAINAANVAGGVNTITLAPGRTFTLTTVNNITDGPNGLPVIAVNNSLTVHGNGATITRTRAANTPAFRLFHVASGAFLTLEDLSLANGLVVGNTGQDGCGGAVLAETGSTLTVRYSNFVGNQVVGGDGAGGLGGFGVGGAIWSDGTASFEYVVFRGNQAFGGATANTPDLSGFGGAALGGAIISKDNGTLTVTHCWFTGNKVIGGLRHHPSAVFDGISDAGAIHTWGTSWITDTTFVENQSLGGRADRGEDGGFACDGAVASGPLAMHAACVIQRCIFSRNQALGADAGPDNFGGAGIGGALSDGPALEASEMTLIDCKFTGNEAVGGAGGVPGDGAGGALNVESPLSLAVTLINVTNCTFTQNRAVGGRAGGNAYGGAITTMDTTTADGSGATLVVSAGRFEDNLAVGAPGGDGINTFGYAQGGGLDIEGKTTIVGSVFQGNQALGGALMSGARANNYTVSWGGALSSWGGPAGSGFGSTVGTVGPGGTLEIRDSSFLGNRVSAGDGSLGGAPSVGMGGGIGIFESWPATIVNCRLLDNEAAGGIGAHSTPGGPGVGGGLAVGYSAVTVTGTTISRNRAVNGSLGGTAMGGGYAVGIGLLFGIPDTSTVTLNGGSVVRHNQPDDGFQL